VSATVSAEPSATHKQRLRRLAESHACAKHPLFDRLGQGKLSVTQAAAVLRNYDAHASVLRRLLLQAATLMPDPAVGFVLENVRNEYGNGNYACNHQGQLLDVAAKAGVSPAMWQAAPMQAGVERFIESVSRLYYPSEQTPLREAVAAGAITATELLAIEEFAALQKAFAHFGLSNHVWFDHVLIEQEHSDESLLLALHFMDSSDGLAAVERGMNAVLTANLDLYDGLLAAAVQ
jgi:pyrroloquinoline quinone (PQQ) biosynthesis protein C